MSGLSARFSKLIDWNGLAVLRTMYPSIAREQSCVDCHNKIQNNSEAWKIGDLMGAYVIDRGVEKTKTRYAAYGIIAGALVTFILYASYIVSIQHQNLRRQAKLLGQLADTDPLTSCLNRRGLSAQTAQIAKEKNDKLALLALDIDHFKSINDEYGHETGDLVLVWFAKTIRSELRANDLLARVGGEEFLVCIDGVTESRARDIAERICRRVAELPFVVGEQEIPVTVSIGAVHWSQEPERTFKRCTQLADEFLYEAKKSGRNRVVWST